VLNETTDDEPALMALEKYLPRRQAGQRPDRESILRERPELASALDCLDALEALAMPRDAEPTGAPVDLSREFGPYQLVREIGRGGMGVVFEARQRGLDRSVALKMILAGNLASPEMVRRFQSEARAAAQLRHANIVPIHDVGQFGGQDFFTMDLIEGQNLAERLAAGPVDPAVACRWVAAVARAVEHLHRRGIVHRDLKPSNILLDADLRPMVTDFGLAKIFDSTSDRTTTGLIAGTPSYMAPEQAAGRASEIGPACDVYSLGAILYELLCGRPPFFAESPLDTLMNVLGAEPIPPRVINPQAPRGLELICLKCLAKNPPDRYASAAALADDLDRFARGEVRSVRPPSPVQRCWTWARRRPALASRLGALSVFYLAETVHYFAGIVDADFHAKISLIAALWALASIGSQRWLETQRWSVPACVVWGTLDSLALLAVLCIGHGAASSLVVVYPLMIVASALWFRVRFVWFMTCLSLLSYGVLVLDFYRWRPQLYEGVYAGFDRHVIVATSLVITGAVTAYLVRRVRALSRFCGSAE